MNSNILLFNNNNNNNKIFFKKSFKITIYYMIL